MILYVVYVFGYDYGLTRLTSSFQRDIMNELKAQLVAFTNAEIVFQCLYAYLLFLNAYCERLYRSVNVRR